MPNSADRPDPRFVPGTARSYIVAFLYPHPDETLGPSEVAERLDISAGDATSNLVELLNEGIIGRTEGDCYHAIETRGYASLRRRSRSARTHVQSVWRVVEPGAI